MKYIIGIDAGGTKSELIAYDLVFCPVYCKTGGFGNPAVNLDKTINNIISLIGDCLNDLGQEDCMLIAIGMAAVETGNYAQLIKDYVERAFVVDTVVLNDAELACKAYFGDKDGILAIAGTGSSCFVQKNGKGQMVGGWSHILGDEGSGYHTVIEVFKNIANKYDKDLPFDKLSKLMLEKIGGTSRSDIMDFIYSNEKNTIASLFPVVVDLSMQGDRYAVDLLESAGRHLAELTCTAYKKAGFKGIVTIGLKGGVFHNSCFIVSSYINEIQNSLKDFEIIGEEISATRGVCSIYRQRQ